MNDIRLATHLISMTKQQYSRYMYSAAVMGFCKSVVSLTLDYLESPKSKDFIRGLNAYYAGAVALDEVKYLKQLVQEDANADLLSINDQEILVLVETAQKLYADPLDDCLFEGILENVYLIDVLPENLVKDVDDAFKQHLYTISDDIPY